MMTVGVVERGARLAELTYKQLKNEIDPRFLKARERIRGLRKRGTRYAGLRGSSMIFRTFSSDYGKNGVIYEQEVELFDLAEKLKQPDRLLRDRVLDALVRGDVGLRCTCLVGDTPVPLLDGRTRTMTELLQEYGTDERFWVYGTDAEGDFVPAKARCLGETGRVKELVRVTLDNDKSFECTPDHSVMMRDGSYRLAGELAAGDSVMPIYRREWDGYEDVLLNSTGRWRRTYWRAAAMANRDELRGAWRVVKESDDETRVACHHDDEDKSNNSPDNLRWMGFHAHWMHHAALVGDRGRRYIEKVMADPELYTKMVENNRRAGKACIEKHPELADAALKAAHEWLRSHRDVLSQRMTKKWANDYDEMLAAVREAANRPEVRAKKSRAQKEAWADPERRAKRVADMRRQRSTDGYREMQRKAQVKAWANPELRKRHSERCKAAYAAKRVLLVNHKVKSVVFVRNIDSVPVYDLEVDTTHNFLIDAGVVVHNCPAFVYWGFGYILHHRRAAAPGRTLWPVRTGKKRWPAPVKQRPRYYGAGSRRNRNWMLKGIMCKHLGLIMEVLGFHWASLVRDLKNQGHE